MSFIQINKKQTDYLKRVCQKGKLPHSCFFCGPEGVGKFEAALDFSMLANGFFDRKSILEGGNPDFVIVKPEIEKKEGKSRKKDISIEQIKRAVGKVGFYAYGSKYKFLIILEAEKMSMTASNSLLKLFEEPSSDTVFILVAHKEQLVLPTLRSRCRQIRFGFSSKEDLVEEAANAYPEISEEKISLAAELGMGRIKFVQACLEEERKLEEFQQGLEKFKNALRGGVAKGFELSEELSSDKEKLLGAMNEWIWYLRGFVQERIVFGDDKRVISKIFSILEHLFKLRNKIETTNANQRIQLDNFFAQIN